MYNLYIIIPHYVCHSNMSQSVNPVEWQNGEVDDPDTIV